MNLQYRNNKSYFLIDHTECITKLYKLSETEKLTLSPQLFSIIHRNVELQTEGKRKRKYNDNIHDEATKVKAMYEEFIREIPSEIKSDILCKYNILDSSSVRQLCKNIYKSTSFDHRGINGGNTSDIPLKCEIKNDYFLIPPKSRFYCGCIKEECAKLDGTKYDIVLADPPWWNKYIRRLKKATDSLSYSMMHNEDIAAIPVKNLFSTNCLVAFWCTNAPSNINAVKDMIFPEWGVKYVATWYWLKVTVDMQPLCSFGSGCHKQPYERLILGKVGEVNDIPEQLIVSVPSALHSHKPPLIELLSPYVKTDNPQILELFARYLLPNTTSVGNEPLKWQHVSLYQPAT